jgi:hypothetical protein
MEVTSMTVLKLGGLVGGAMVLGLASPAFAHHSHAMYDLTQETSITGNVLDFKYTNPHGALFIAVEDGSGQLVRYWIEMSNLTNMVDRGIKRTTFQRGDKITVKMHPLKDGRPGGSYTTILAADGKTYE